MVMFSGPKSANCKICPLLQSENVGWGAGVYPTSDWAEIFFGKSQHYIFSYKKGFRGAHQSLKFKKNGEITMVFKYTCWLVMSESQVKRSLPNPGYHIMVCKELFSSTMSSGSSYVRPSVSPESLSTLSLLLSASSFTSLSSEHISSNRRSTNYLVLFLFITKRYKQEYGTCGFWQPSSNKMKI